MTSAAWLAFGAFAVAAVLDWVARARDDRRLEYVTKPAALMLLIVVALLLDPDDGAQRAWFVAALCFSLLGDVLLMLPRDLFVGGLAAFLVAHLCYIPGLWSEGVTPARFVVAAIVVAVVLVPVAARILGALRAGGDPGLAPPVTAYIVVIATMLASAAASYDLVAIAGAALFVLSDSLIAWNRFVRPLAWASVAIMVTYHVGQALLTLSLVT